MPQPLERRKKLRRKAVGPLGSCSKTYRAHAPTFVRRWWNFSETGLRVHVSLWLRASRLVVVKGDTGVVPNGKANARVVDCRPLAGSGYTAGLTFVAPDETRALDYYEILQVSRKADQETIECVYKFQAQRYRPENRRTGDPKTFQAVKEAYRVLSDPAKRAEYDLHDLKAPEDSIS